MAKTRQELKKEIDELQEYIDAVEAARDCGLQLDASVFPKYTAAMEKQKMLGEELQAIEATANRFRTSAQLLRKEAELRTDDCKIEAVVKLSEDGFNTFRNRLLADYDFIAEHRDYMYQDRNGVSHCLLVLGEGQTKFSFTVVDKDGNATEFEIHTDKATVGEALLELNLIAGDESEYGLYVKQVNGITADYDVDQTYWAFYVNDAYATGGVDTTAVEAGAKYAFKVEK